MFEIESIQEALPWVILYIAALGGLILFGKFLHDRDAEIRNQKH